MSLWLMAAALEHQTRSQEISAVSEEAMHDPKGRAQIQAHSHVRMQTVNLFMTCTAVLISG